MRDCHRHAISWAVVVLTKEFPHVVTINFHLKEVVESMANLPAVGAFFWVKPRDWLAAETT
jgi:hypothetical protein